MLFSNSCKEIIVKDASDLDEIKNFLDTFAFKNHDTKYDHENLCFYIFLLKTLKTGNTVFPLTIVKAESPDFRLYRVGKEPYLGLEHTRAIIDKCKIDEAELKNNRGEYQNCFIDYSYYKPSNTLPRKTKIAIVPKLTGPGWVNDQPENEWAETIMEAITAKTQSLNKEHVLKFPQNELIVEYDGPVMPNLLTIDKAIGILQEKYVANNFNNTYNKIHVFSDPNFAYDVFGKTITWSEF